LTDWEAQRAHMGLAMFRLFLFVFAVVTLTAQPVWYTSLSATDDGETLYFASPLVLRGSEATVGMRVYRYTSAGIDQVAKVSTYPLQPQEVGIDISGEAIVVAWWDWTLQVLNPSQPGAYTGVADAVLSAGGAHQGFNRYVAVSRNGRYALLYGGAPDGPPTLIDRVTGAQYLAPAGTVAAGRHSLASTGQVMLAPAWGNPAHELYLWSPTETRTIPYNPGYGFPGPVLSDDASRFFWADLKSLHMIDTSTGRDTTIATFPHTGIRNFSVDRAGDLLAAVVDPADGIPPQLYLVRTDGSAPRQVALREHGYREAALSGDGRMVFGSTLDVAMVRVDTATGDTTEIVAGPPTVSYFTSESGSLWPYPGAYGRPTLVPGSQYRLRGELLPNTVSLGSTPLRILWASDSDMRFQVPLDAQLGDSDLHFPSASPFEEVVPVQVRAVGPLFLGYWEAGLSPGPIVKPLIVKGDFSGLVESPSPGDVLNFYMAGLGAVSPAVATGAAAPANPPALVTDSVTATLQVVTLTDGGHGPKVSFSPEVYFAGLAPDLIGVYQVTLKIPDSLGLATGEHATTLEVHVGSASVNTYFQTTIK
jgi:uncharacterized protein (TIGR03437 family)